MPAALRRAIVRRFVILVTVVAGVIGAFAPIAIERHEASRVDVIVAREQGYLSSVDSSLSQEFAEINGNLHVLATVAGTLHATERADAFAQGVTQVLRSAAAGYRRYAQLRFLDTAGMERVRVEFREGRAEVVPDGQLQDKSSRPYFQEAATLSPGQHYISPLELNQERGRIETPLNPTIRFAAPVIGAAGDRVGVLVLNYQARAIAERVRETVPLSHGVSSLLVDSDGWPLVDGQTDLGEALLHHNADAGLGATQPALWAALQSAPEGRYRGPDGLYLFRAIHPLGTAAAYGADAFSDRFAWTVLRFIPDASLYATSFFRSGEGRSLMAGAALAVLGALWLIAHFSVRESWQRTQRLHTAEAGEAELRALIDAAPGGILVTDHDGRIVRANRAMEALFGYPPEVLLGESVDALLPERLRGIHASVRDRFMNEPGPRAARSSGVHGDFIGLNKAGEEVPVAVSLNVLVQDGAPCIVSSIVDLRQYKAQQRELKMAKEQAESANRAKSAFLATMSHEIRTPLNAIIGGAYLLGQSRLDAAQREDLATIEVSGRNLLGLINDILDFSKIEAGELELDAHDFHLGAMLDELQRMFAPVAASKGIGLDVTGVPGGVPATLHADGNRLRQMLINLIGNAIKFTEYGTVGVRIACTTPPGDIPMRLRFEVHDSGIGIAPDVLPKLFDAFAQADASTTRRFGGSGLGLSIVKRLAELMGGALGAQSRPGRGSLFWLELPFEAAQGGLTEHGTVRPEHPLQVMIADDEEADRQLMMALCTRFGWEATVVSGGQALVEACLARVVGGGQVDCLLLDWRMPGMDGIEAIARLGDWLDAARMPVVVMVTAHDREALMREAVDARPHSILTKPVNPSALFNTVNEAVYAKRHDLAQVMLGTLVDVTHSQWLKGVRILVVDDSRMNLDVVSRILVHEGAVAICCDSGDEAVSALTANPTGFDAVLMDLQMPGMDGCEATRAIRRLPACLALPVIALTAGATTTEKTRTEAAGMTGFLGKPVDPVRLVRVLREQIEARRGTPLPLHPRDVDAAADAAWPTLPGIDTVAVRSSLHGDLALFCRLMRGCTQTFAPLLAQIGAVSTREDFADVADRLHKLRGQLGNLGAVVLARQAEPLEAAVRAGQVPEEAAVAEFAGRLTRLADAVAAWGGEVPAAPAGAVGCDLTRLAPLIARLRSDLGDQKMSALGLCEQLVQQVKGSHLETPCRRLAEAVTGLRFKVALAALDALIEADEQVRKPPDGAASKPG